MQQKRWRMKDFGHAGLYQFYHEAVSFPARDNRTENIPGLLSYGTKMHNGDSL
jgi:hypothetical protein